MIKETIQQTIEQMSPHLVACGLASHQIKDATMLAEVVVFSTFRDKITKEKEKELLVLLNSESTPKISILQRVKQYLFKDLLEKGLVKSYKIELTGRLQMNSTYASTIAKSLMPAILQSIITITSKEIINEKRLFSMINDTGLKTAVSK
jgi:hypothetical protein